MSNRYREREEEENDATRVRDTTLLYQRSLRPQQRLAVARKATGSPR
jgi:hypothetical protein